MKLRTSISILLALAGLMILPSASQAAFGFEGLGLSFLNSEGGEAMQAGAHPDEMVTTITFNSTPASEGGAISDEPTRDVEVTLPEGFAGSALAVPQCSDADFFTLVTDRAATNVPACPDDTAVGVIAAHVGGRVAVGHYYGAIYNLVPPPGTAAKLGFEIGSVWTVIEVTLSEGFPYRLEAHVPRISRVLEVIGAKLTLWGVPWDHSHDALRGLCLNPGLGTSLGKCPVGGDVKPFITLPRACEGPLSANFAIDSWWHPGARLPSGHPDLSDPNWIVADAVTHDGSLPPNPAGFSGCSRVGLNATIEGGVTSESAETGSGLDFTLDVHDPGLENPEGIAGSDIKKAVVRLPEGVTVNPSVAEGLAVCTPAQLARETSTSAPGDGCPQASKLGTLRVESPLVEQPIEGSVYQAEEDDPATTEHGAENPFDSLIALYFVLQNPRLGVSVVEPVKVEPDPRSGQLIATLDNNLQIPFSHFELHLRTGARAALVTPGACGTYTTSAELTPWADQNRPVTAAASFKITRGVNGGPCPSGGTPPFHPGLIAGTINNAAGAYSPFDVRLFRADGEQEITHFSIKLPPGVTGKLAGIPFCPEIDIAAARAREHDGGGREEQASPSCPAASEIGHTLVGVGVGSVLTYVPGKVYMAGPYHGSNLSIVAITSGVVGPFDVGTVVIHEALKVDPETAEVSVDAAGSDPIPHIIDGIPVHARDIRVYVDRPGFVLNPTSCEPTSTASTVLGSGTNFATEADDRPVTVTTRFQAADCASLGFRPRIKLMLKGATKRTGLPRLKAVVRPRPGDANIGRAVVTLPRSEFLEQGHIGTTCTRVQFNAGGGNGEQCPAKSVYGRAKAWTPLLSEPLTGPVFLRSNGGERKLPDLVAALHSKDIDIDLLGFIKSLHPKGASFSRIRTIFASVPDAPVSRFTLEMFGGKKSLLINSVDLCKGRHRAISKFVGQNGKKDETHPAVRVRCKRKGKHHKKAHGHSRHTRRANAWRGGRRHGR